MAYFLVLLTRSGTGPDIVGVESVAVDASDSEALSAKTKGADVLYNCASPGPYGLGSARCWCGS